ncbi:hypothetical protein QK292_17460 [Arthrobacter sp. AL08]|uniref:hypothetical protein n=1 Tax=Micrococcaceae TaxID=1268 RepID=UPI001D0018D7|nr:MULTISPECIES: hypothetical protein [Micrococcaceae]MCB5283607.1 hypothetical protein [Arthrobacter sp. ES1]MDI3243351.1 hypothetical protein [Arthrobacter sp. AL05]MDI3279343.1 hypothetical protein [Arthrobacter sp. AL08]MDJ0354279.1 hypothetical protein [Pseudarthrobacter sp. PH31-O2]WGZ80818.1 hypothetical protein QI450_06440 [Arthrobacter sp. EM1]
MNLGLLLEGQDDPAGARNAYQIAIDSGDEDVAPFAELLLGEYCTDGDLQARLDHRKRAAASGNPEVLMSIAELYLAGGAVPLARQLLLKAVKAGSTIAADCLLLFPQDAADAVDERASRRRGLR